MDAFVWVVTVLVLVVLVRNQLSGQWTRRAINALHERHERLIAANEFSMAMLDEYDTVGCRQIPLIFDLRVWSYERAFGDFFEEAA